MLTVTRSHVGKRVVYTPPDDVHPVQLPQTALIIGTGSVKTCCGRLPCYHIRLDNPRPGQPAHMRVRPDRLRFPAREVSP